MQQSIYCNLHQCDFFAAPSRRAGPRRCINVVYATNVHFCTALLTRRLVNGAVTTPVLPMAVENFVWQRTLGIVNSMNAFRWAVAAGNKPARYGVQHIRNTQGNKRYEPGMTSPAFVHGVMFGEKWPKVEDDADPPEYLEKIVLV
ncbi:hypothetical protein CLAIMM_14467 isoform 3 [Cladophialophora immunda]|nr:hypothetical protein CLAIMM_14467 isoform 1 [Cladophialophora immunda]OQV10476.1 hypothetical protein CLAIMM_14467 isoform 3 [Cladophialophora immunda]